MRPTHTTYRCQGHNRATLVVIVIVLALLVLLSSVVYGAVTDVADALRGVAL